MKVISEPEFKEAITEALKDIQCGSVTGPGRSGALAAVYASHILHVPFMPYKSLVGCLVGVHLLPLLIIDTAIETGRTLKKCALFYMDIPHIILSVYQEPPRVMFWYESTKPQHYKHEEKSE